MKTMPLSPALVALLGILLVSPVGMAVETVRFTGTTVQDKRGDVTVIGKKEAGIIGVTSLNSHYGLILPYAEDWTFRLEYIPLLRGSSGLVNLTLSVEWCEDTPAEHLETHRKDIESNPAVKGIEKFERVTFKNEPVLHQVQDAVAATGNKLFQGVKIHHFFAAKKWGYDLYMLHLSKVVPPDETLNEELFLTLITTGFTVDFMREKEKK